MVSGWRSVRAPAAVWRLVRAAAAAIGCGNKILKAKRFAMLPIRVDVKKQVSSFVVGGVLGAGGVVISVLISGGRLSPAVRSQAAQSGLFLGTILGIGSLVR
jgi:hypothetical protein